MTVDTILICTVGGSHQPIGTAIRDLRPDHVCFVCSGKDLGTEKPGSDTQIIGKGLCIKAGANDEKASLPNIPAQTNLAADAYEIIIVPADDLDAAVIAVRAALNRVKEHFPGARIVADYTGGTKSMSAALVLEALEHDGVELQLVTGNRANLIKVQDGTEASTPAIADAVRLNRAMTPYLLAWGRYAYDEAAAGLAGIRSPGNAVLRSRLARARDLSKAFSAWDRFDHTEALRLLEPYARVVKDDLEKHLGALKDLVAESTKQEPMRLFDLWRNAERRAAQGRYDDAVARVYRLVEWTAQWLLLSRCGIDTADVPSEMIPFGMDIPPNRDGKRPAGLFVAWTLVEKLIDGPARTFASDHLPALLGHVQTRNLSILAHGYTPIGREAWEKQRPWLEKIFLPMLLAEAKTVQLHAMPPQLPTFYSWRD